MYGIQHVPDGMWWMDSRMTAVAGVRVGSAWSTNPARARRFVTKEDAERTAYVECPYPFSDLAAVELPGTLRLSA